MSAKLKWLKRAGKHYKIIYRLENNIIKIVAVWDCRQDSHKLKDMF